MNRVPRTGVPRARLRAVLLLGVAALPCALGACGSIRLGGERSVSEENDRLRTQVHEQQERIKALEGEREELKVKLAEASRARGTIPEGITDAIPAVTTVKISMLSGLEPVTADQPATGVSVTFQPLDGRGRFTQAVGTALIEVFQIPPKMDGAEPRRIAQATLTPAALRDAYRSNVTGTYYSATLPLESPVKRSQVTPALLIRLEFTDALTGEVHKAERLLPERPSAL